MFNSKETNSVVEDMLEFLGEETEISFIDTFYYLKIDNEEWRWTDDMLEPVTDKCNKVVRIEDADFTVRTYNSLKRGGINTLGELEKMTEEDLMSIRNMGRTSLEEIKAKINIKDALSTEGTKREILNILEKYNVRLDVYNRYGDNYIHVVCNDDKFESVEL